jgi:hypothetical protein
LSFFERDSAFFMASEGQLVFPSFDSAATFVHMLSQHIARIELAWTDVRIDPIAPGTAILAAAYREVQTDAAGRETRERGYFTGLAVHTASGWQLRNAHWSAQPGRPRGSELQ